MKSVDRLSKVNKLSIVASFGVLAGIVGCGSSTPAQRPVVVAPLQTSADGAAAGNQPAKPKQDRVAKFAELDTNKDGQLSKDEFCAGRERTEAERWFGRRDVDHNGSVSLEEFTPPLPIGYVEPGTSSGGPNGDTRMRDKALPPGESPGR
jgi:hypothetical protein